MTQHNNLEAEAEAIAKSPWSYASEDVSATIRKLIRHSDVMFKFGMVFGFFGSLAINIALTFIRVYWE